MDQIISNFEQAIEVDLRRLAEDVKVRRERPELQGAGDREIVRHAIRAIADGATAPPPAPASPQTASGKTTINNPLPDYAASAPAETKLEIEYLLELAFKKGIAQANREAKKSSPFVLDAFHDALAGKLYEELKKRGMVR